MPSTIFTSDSRNAGGGGGGRCIDYTQDGTLWTTLVDGTTNEIFWYQSFDSGANWSEVAAMRLTPVSEEHSFFIDKDNYIHLVYLDSASTRSYNLGTPNDPVNPTSYTWGTPLNIVTIGNFLDMEIVAHREGTGWKAHIVHTNTDGAGPTTKCLYTRIDITAAHNYSIDVTTTLHDYGVNGSNYCAIDFRHTQADPKAVQSSTPSVYVVYHEGGGALFYKKIAYSAGVWTPGTERTIDASGQFGTSGLQTLLYDGTRILMTHERTGPDGVVRIDERDEADTTTTNRNPTALADGAIQNMAIGYTATNQDIWCVAQGATSADWKKIRFNRGAGTWAGAWTVLEADTTAGSHTLAMMRGLSPGGTLGVAYVLFSPSPNQDRYAAVVSEWQGSAILQGVATIDPNASLGMIGSASLQGVATMEPGIGSQGHGGAAALQGVATLGAEGGYKPSLDFTVYDLYLDDGQNVYACIVHEDAETKGATRANPIRAEKQDVGQNPAEQRPEFGDYFAQGDFSHGGDQEYFHHVGRDERKYLVGEGFNISEPGLLRHLHAIGETLDSATVGAVTQADSVLFIADGTVVKKHNGILPGAWASEDPHAGESATTVADVTSRGDEIFAALGANGVHIRSAAGAWTHFRPDGSTALVAGSVTRVAWLKDRLFVVGTGGREIFEVVSDSTPTAIKTLPEGWTFESIFEAGAFVYAPAVNAEAGLSRVHILGLNNDATVIEDKGSVPIPRGELIYAGLGDPGGIFLGGGRKTPDGGYDPVFYQAVQGDNGFLQLLKIAEGEGAQALDCSVRSFEALGDAIVMSWSVGSGAPEGARTGLAWYHLGRQAFAYHLRKVAPAAAPVTDIIFHRGALFFVVSGDGLYYEKTSEYVTEAYLISSIADWGSAGLKSWDASEVAHKALPATANVLLQYTTEHPDQGDWRTVVSSSTADTLGAFGRLSDVVSRQFAVRILSRAASGLASAPEIQSFSVRSNPTRSSPEYVLSRFVRILAKDRKDGLGSEVFTDPVTRRIAILQLLDSWVTVYEPGITWTAFVKDVADAEPAEPFVNSTSGERLKQAYLVRLDMVATGEAA